MSLVEWKNSYLTGIRQFDEHHRHLVCLLNMTYDGIITNAPSDELGAVLDELVDYTHYHFAAEELWMMEHQYPRLEEHVSQHAKFSSQVAEIRADYYSGKSLLDIAVLNFLTDWLLEHILGTDSDYGIFIASKGLPKGVDLDQV